MPVRQEFLYTARSDARRRLGLDQRPLIVSYWGSLGAREMNKKIAGFMLREVKEGEPYQHIHATGSFGWRWMPAYVRENGVALEAQPSIDMREYIYDMPLLMAITIISALFVFGGNFIANILYGVIDPRIRRGGAGR